MPQCLSANRVHALNCLPLGGLSSLCKHSINLFLLSYCSYKFNEIYIARFYFRPYESSKIVHKNNLIFFYMNSCCFQIISIDLHLLNDILNNSHIAISSSKGLEDLTSLRNNKQYCQIICLANKVLQH